MNFLRSIRADLVDKRLLPVVIVLAAVAVLVPIGALVLTGSGSSASPVVGPPVVATPPPGTPSPATALASVAGPGTPSATRYTKPELDPFRPRAAGAAAAAVTVKTTGAGTGTAAKATPATTTPTNPAAPVKASPTKPVPPVTTTPTTTTPTTTTPGSTPSPQAQLAKLGRRDSYSVDVNVVDATGAHGLTGLARLSPLPSTTNPLIEYLGVLKSRRAAAFLVNPGVVVQGPGACLPRTGDCQVLVLTPGQLEALGVRTAGAPIVQASIAVAGWRVVTHSSVAAARQARSLEVKQGRTLVTQSAQPALSDLVYTVAQGAVSIIPAIINALPATLTKLLGG